MSNPFECPITLSLMENPVIGPDGYTYEERAITKWLEKHGTSPQTRKTMSVDELIPNRAIAELLARENNNGVNTNIRSLLAQLPVLNIDTIQQEEADERSSTSLLLLELMKNASCALGLINQHSIENHVNLIIEAGGIGPLIEQTKRTGMIKQKAVRALHGLARNNDVAKQTIGREGGIPPLVEILKSGSLLHKLTAVSTLVTLARNNTDNRILITAETIGIKELTESTHEGSHRQKEITACALLQWTAHVDNASQTTRKHGISPFRWIAEHSTPAQKEKAMAALATWAVEHEDSQCPER